MGDFAGPACAGGILRVGAVASVQSVRISITIALATALIAVGAGVDDVAGFGTAVRLE